MTLQYRIRPKYEDQRWKHRVCLCDKLLSDAMDHWCREDAEFPTRHVVAQVLYLFSPRCEPFELSPYRICERLGDLVETPEGEYQIAWPRREESQSKALIASLSAIVAGAVESWTDRGAGYPSSGELAERLAEEILAQRYVIFHHCQSTRRDINHWGI
jgi:hypothetical protein